MEEREMNRWIDYEYGFELTYDEDGYVCLVEDDNN